MTGFMQKKNETATRQHTFHKAEDFAKFKERFKAPWFQNAE